MKEKKISALRIQSRALQEIHRFFAEKGFIELMPVMLSTVTDPLGPDPDSSVIKTPEIEYLGQKLVLTQSMILHKQILASQGVERFYILSPNIRLEHPKRATTGKHLFEFTQVDFEIAGATMEDVMELVEELFTRVVKVVKKECREELEVWERKLRTPRPPFRRFTVAELKEKYGEEWEEIASRKARDLFWVLDHKREFYDREDRERPGHYRNYDLIYPEGFGEALSGGEREWELERIIERMKRDKLPQEKYRKYLHFARKFVPTAGAGFGVERLTRFLAGAGHIREVVPFPRVPGETVSI